MNQLVNNLKRILELNGPTIKAWFQDVFIQNNGHEWYSIQANNTVITPSLQETYHGRIKR